MTVAPMVEREALADALEAYRLAREVLRGVEYVYRHRYGGKAKTEEARMALFVAAVAVAEEVYVNGPGQ
jgi:hypothetical protein